MGDASRPTAHGGSSPTPAHFRIADLLPLVFENAGEGVLLASTDGTILAANPAACRILGRSQEEICRIGRAGILDPADPALPAALEEGERTGCLHAALTALRPDGSRVPLEVSATVQATSEPPSPMVLFLRDLSEHRAGEVLPPGRELLLQAQKMESLSAFAGGVARDFNNLLAAVLANAEAVAAALPHGSPEQRALDDVAAAARRGAAMVRQLLSFAGRARVTRQPLDLSQVVNDVLHILRAAVPRKITLDLALGERAPLVGDRRQLGQALVNLVLNASEAIGEAEGHVAISTGVEKCEPGHPALDLARPPLEPGPYSWLEVRDDGPGMAPEVVARIFDPFFTTRPGGRGLGLSAVAGVVRVHGGAVQVESTPGHGSRFRLWLPAVGPVPAPRRAVPAAAPEGTVLVVDDEPMVRRLARWILEEGGFSVLEAADGAEAVEVVSTHQDVDVVLLDLEMPRMHGAETFDALRALRPGLPVLLSTGYGDQVRMDRFRGVGLAGTLEKPYAVSQLLAAVRAALAGKR